MIKLKYSTPYEPKIFQRKQKDIFKGRKFFKLGNFSFNNRKIKFKDDLLIELLIESGLWIFKNKKFDIISHGENFKEASENFLQELFFIYDEYVLEADENLSPKALEYKNTLKNLVEFIS